MSSTAIFVYPTFASLKRQKVYNPREHHDLSSLRHIYSTCSPLAPALYDYVYQKVHPNILLASITGKLVIGYFINRSTEGTARYLGGTDICSLFAGMCSALPVYRGELQCRLLGMAIATYTTTGTLSSPGEPGELVCLRPFPCMPVGFWPLRGFGTKEAEETATARYQQAYFSEFEDVWCKITFVSVFLLIHANLKQIKTMVIML